MRGRLFPVTFNSWPLWNKPSKPNRCWGDVPQRSLGPIFSFFTAMFQSVMFIYRNLYYSAIAASGKGSSLLRVLGSLQKLLLSQRRDGRLNNHFSITVTMWEQLFASEGMPAIVSDILKQRRKERRQGGRGRWKESFFLLDSVLLRGLILILPADLQMYVPKHLHKYVHPSLDTHLCMSTNTYTHTDAH